MFGKEKRRAKEYYIPLEDLTLEQTAQQSLLVLESIDATLKEILASLGNVTVEQLERIADVTAAGIKANTERLESVTLRPEQPQPAPTPTPTPIPTPTE